MDLACGVQGFVRRECYRDARGTNRSRSTSSATHARRLARLLSRQSGPPVSISVPSSGRLAWHGQGPGQALAEVTLPENLGRNELDVHPLIMDGCFQVVGIARNMTGEPGEATYLPFGWERFWLNRRLPDRVFCHVIMNQSDQDSDPDIQPEVLSGELRIYDPERRSNRRFHLDTPSSALQRQLCSLQSRVLTISFMRWFGENANLKTAYCPPISCLAPTK